jgi:hypothetical protein
MLFPYTYINHSIEKLQEYINHLFLEVWCKAEGDYDIELLHPDLKDITLEIYNDPRITNDYLYGPIQVVFEIFAGFDQDVRDGLARAYRDNNSIADLCKQTNGCEPLLYSALRSIDLRLGEELERFFKHLFAKVIDLSAVKKRTGDIADHYKRFMEQNDEGICPFCGVNSVKGQHNTKREAYDHYLPKDLYPFNSINFRNLAPMCHECNSSYKGTKDPLHRSNRSRRKSFYPYDVISTNMSISIALRNANIGNLKPEDIDLTISSNGNDEKVESWMDVFGIEERYKAKCLSKNDGKYWLIQATDEYNTLPPEVKAMFSQQQWVQKQVNYAKAKPHASGNFLKAEFLEACRRAGVLG